MIPGEHEGSVDDPSSPIANDGEAKEVRQPWNEVAQDPMYLRLGSPEQRAQFANGQIRAKRRAGDPVSRLLTIVTNFSSRRFRRPRYCSCCTSGRCVSQRAIAIFSARRTGPPAEPVLGCHPHGWHRGGLQPKMLLQAPGLTLVPVRPPGNASVCVPGCAQTTRSGAYSIFTG